MNVKSITEGLQIQLELKYCERCGGLWLRVQETVGIYCASCHVRLAALRIPVDSRLSPRISSSHKKYTQRHGADDRVEELRNPAKIRYLQGVALAEVWL